MFKTQPICFVQMASLKRGIKLHMHCPGQLFFLGPICILMEGGQPSSLAAQSSTTAALLPTYSRPTVDKLQPYCSLLQPFCRLALLECSALLSLHARVLLLLLLFIHLTYYEVRTNKINNTKISHFLLKMHMLYHQTFLLSFCYVILQVTIVFNLNLS